MIKGIGFGVIAGVAGAAIWAGISYGTGYEIGWMAWGVGLLVGWAVALGEGKRGILAGVVAAVLASVAMLGGKYVALGMMLDKVMDESELADSFLDELSNEELAVSFLADEVVLEREEAGEEVEWPENVDPLEASTQSDYPEDVWASAQQLWDEMTESEREDYVKRVASMLSEEVRMGYAEINPNGFLQNFGWAHLYLFLSFFDWMDGLFFTLGITTAFQIASRGGLSREPTG